MQEEIKRRKCDECGKTEEVSGIRIGGAMFAGWLQLTLADYSVAPMLTAYSGSSEAGPSRSPWDFCCTDCLIKFLTNARKEMRKQLREHNKRMARMNEAIMRLHQKQGRK